MRQAYINLTGPGSRAGAFKAIVVVTDKVSDRDLAGNTYQTPGSNGPASVDTMVVANQCHTKGIPIFVMALDQTGGGMTPYFQSQFSDTAEGGLIKTADNGGVLSINNCVNAASTNSSLAGSLNNIVRQLMTLVQG